MNLNLFKRIPSVLHCGRPPHTENDVSQSAANETSKLHDFYMYHYRTQYCERFANRTCDQAKPYTCVMAHYENHLRRKPILTGDGRFNYSPNVCSFASILECPDGHLCPLSHRAQKENIYHPLVYKTQFCDMAVNSQGECAEYGRHCSKAHGEHDLRVPHSSHLARFRRTSKSLIHMSSNSRSGGHHSDNALMSHPLPLVPQQQTSSPRTTGVPTHGSSSGGTHIPSSSQRVGGGMMQTTSSSTSLISNMSRMQFDHFIPPQKELEAHERYMYEFRTRTCPYITLDSKSGDSNSACPCDVYSCFDCHSRTPRRRKPQLQNGRFNYIPTRCRYILEEKECPQGVHCRFAHGTEEVIYHPSKYKTQLCSSSVDENGHCTSFGPHCAKAHGPRDRRNPVFEESEEGPRIQDISQFVCPKQQQDEERNFYMYHYKTKKCVGFPWNCQCNGMDYHRLQESRRGPEVEYGPVACTNVKPFSNSDWASPEICPKGDQCEFAHTLLELMYHPLVYKTGLCDHFDENNPSLWKCVWKRRCAHAHGREDIRPKPEKAEFFSFPSHAASSSSSNNISSHPSNLSRENSNSSMKHRHIPPFSTPQIEYNGLSVGPGTAQSENRWSSPFSLFGNQDDMSQSKVQSQMLQHPQTRTVVPGVSMQQQQSTAIQQQSGIQPSSNLPLHVVPQSQQQSEINQETNSDTSSEWKLFGFTKCLPKGWPGAGDGFSLGFLPSIRSSDQSPSLGGANDDSSFHEDSWLNHSNPVNADQREELSPEHYGLSVPPDESLPQSPRNSMAMVETSSTSPLMPPQSLRTISGSVNIPQSSPQSPRNSPQSPRSSSQSPNSPRSPRRSYDEGGHEIKDAQGSGDHEIEQYSGKHQIGTLTIFPEQIVELANSTYFRGEVADGTSVLVERHDRSSTLGIPSIQVALQRILEMGRSVDRYFLAPLMDMTCKEQTVYMSRLEYPEGDLMTITRQFHHDSNEEDDEDERDDEDDSFSISDDELMGLSPSSPLPPLVQHEESLVEMKHNFPDDSSHSSSCSPRSDSMRSNNQPTHTASDGVREKRPHVNITTPSTRRERSFQGTDEASKNGEGDLNPTSFRTSVSHGGMLFAGLGESLQDLEPCRIIKQLFTALDFLHQHGISHNALSPSCINFTENRSQIRVSNAVTGVSSLIWQAPEFEFKTESETPSSSISLSGSPESDIFSAGCITYYILSEGVHPFDPTGSVFSGGDLQRNRILSEMNSGISPSLDSLNPIERDLVQNTLSNRPNCRLSALDVLAHPYFWTGAHRLNLLRSVTVFLNGNSKILISSSTSNKTPSVININHSQTSSSDISQSLINSFSAALESYAPKVFKTNSGRGVSWKHTINPKLYNYEFETKTSEKRNPKKLSSLLQLIRNFTREWNDLPHEIRNIFAPHASSNQDYSIDGVTAVGEYFFSKFPNLFIVIYNLVKQHGNLAGHRIFRQFFTRCRVLSDQSDAVSLSNSEISTMMSCPFGKNGKHMLSEPVITRCCGTSLCRTCLPDFYAQVRSTKRCGVRCGSKTSVDAERKYFESAPVNKTLVSILSLISNSLSSPRPAKRVK